MRQMMKKFAQMTGGGMKKFGKKGRMKFPF